MRSSTRRTVLWALALVVALAVVGVAFVRGDGGDEAAAVAPGPGVPGDAGSGCGAAATTDPTDVGVDRTVARCATGAPAAVPLRSTATVRVALTDRSEAAAPLLVAVATGELAEERLAVDVVDTDAAAAYAAMGRGDVDVVVGGLDGPFFDAVASGLGARVVLGGQVARHPSDLDEPQTGLWLRADLLGEPDGDDAARAWANVAGQTVLVPGGLGSAALYPIDTTLTENELGANAVDVLPATAAEAAERLRAAAVGGAWLPEPWATQAASDRALRLVSTTPGSESITGTVFSPRLLGPDRAVGDAYARAVIRTVNTHLRDGYDDAALAAVARALGVERGDVAAGPPPLFDWEVRSGTTDRVQDALTPLGGVRHDRSLAEAAVVDRSVAARVIAAAAP
ncbi:MAG TPA: hypothetical protein VFW63_13085 [Acidimicrobiales bacterium]|nr:hypothetical protein [Acidimicrobiales bacterium]